MQLIFVLMLVFSVLVAIIAVQNTTPVTLTFLVFQLQNVPVAIVVLISVALGAILMLILGVASRIRTARTLRDRDRRIAELESELATYRMSHFEPEHTPLLPSEEHSPGETGAAS